MTDHVENEFTDEELEDVVEMLTEDDLRQRSQKLDETQELYEELAYLANPKMPCPECSNEGTLMYKEGCLTCSSCGYSKCG